MPRKVNPFGKSRKVDEPYAVYKGDSRLGFIEYRVLKTYKHPDNENGQFDRWFVAGKSDATFGSWGYGDMYKAEIVKYFRCEDCTSEWAKYYNTVDTVEEYLNATKGGV